MTASDGDTTPSPLTSGSEPGDAAARSPSLSEMDAFLVTIGAKATPFFVSDMRAGANLNASRRNV